MNGSFSADRIRGETGSNKTNSRTNGESPHGGLWEDNKMKKVLAAIAAVMILASVGTMSVSAAGRGYGAGNGMGGGHHGSHPHLVHEFVRSIVEQRKPWIDWELAANITGAGILAHESALRGGEWLKAD